MESEIKTTVTYKTEVVNGKEVQVEITRRNGLQVLKINEEPTLVECVTYKKYPGSIGTQRNYTIAKKPKSKEEIAAQIFMVNDIYAKSLVNERNYIYEKSDTN